MPDKRLCDLDMQSESPSQSSAATAASSVDNSPQPKKITLVRQNGFKVKASFVKPMVPKVSELVAVTKAIPYLSTADDEPTGAVKKSYLSITDDEPARAVKLAYECKICSMTFDRSQKLGGHCSRLHPGQNTVYNKKIEKRREREHIRESLRLARELVKRTDFTSESDYLKCLKKARKSLESSTATSQ